MTNPSASRFRSGHARPGLRALATLASLALVIALAAMPAWAHVPPDDFNHLWNAHIKPLLQDPGTINDAQNPVHWTKLKGVPAGLADGLDQGVTNAGFGLSHTFGNGFRVNTSEIQRRVNGTCPAGQAIRTVHADGAVTCQSAGGGNAVSVGQLRNTGLICNGGCSEGTIPLGPGNWAIWGKITLVQQDFDEDLLNAECSLSTSRDNFDRAFTRLVGDTSGDPGSTASATLNMELFAEVPSGGTADLSCTDHDIGDVNGLDLYLLAIRTS